MQKVMQELDECCEDGYVLMVEAAATAQQHKPQLVDQSLQFTSVGTTRTTSANNNKNNNTTLSAIARSSSASSYASGQAIEKMAQKARARPVLAAPKVVMDTINSNDNDDDSNTNNAVVIEQSSQQAASQKSRTRSFGHDQQPSQSITPATPPVLLKEEEEEDVIIVETVNEHDDDDDDASGPKGNDSNRQHEENNNTTCDFSTTFEYNPPSEAKHAIPMAMTVLATIVIAVTMLVYNSTHQNRFLTAFVWLVLALIFTGLVFIAREHLKDDTTTTRQALGPLWGMVCTEYQNFKQDWREQVMLLKNVAENQFPDEPLTTVAATIDHSATNRGDAADALTSSSSFNNPKEPSSAIACHYKKSISFAGRKSRRQQQQPSVCEKQRQPKSKIFRALVKPLLPVMIGRKRRAQRRKEALELVGQMIENDGVAILS